MTKGNNQGTIVVDSVTYHPETASGKPFVVIYGFIIDTDGNRGRFPVSVIVGCDLINEPIGQGDQFYFSASWDELGTIHAMRFERE
jgi:hypothetical protein